MTDGDHLTAYSRSRAADLFRDPLPTLPHGAESVGATRFCVTRFQNVKSVKRIQQTMTLDELTTLIKRPTATEKKGLPLLKLARFGDKPSAHGILRHDKNVLAVSGVEVDYDAEAIPFKEAVEVIRRADVLAILYTSPSHTPQKPRWRIICPFSEEKAPGERKRHVARLNGIFGGALAGESFTLS